ncbi:HPr family phosphocarrier protein, partial [Methanocalculus natronophilus]|uniref:HPr family phosphocarrier protein n=1 Tax=Methanocalculus natronophilus TaxID=1262400 RepID=UPI0031B590D9
MVEREYKVIDEAGLHARPVSIMVEKASNFDNNIYLMYEDKKVTLKSIMLVMSLGIAQGSTFKIGVEGKHANEVLDALE